MRIRGGRRARRRSVDDERAEAADAPRALHAADAGVFALLFEHRAAHAAAALTFDAVAAAAVDAGSRADGRGLIVSSSRAIIYASSGHDFAAAARTAAMEARLATQHDDPADRR